MPATKASTKKPAPKSSAKSGRMSLAQVMAELKQAGSAQTRKTYARHGAAEPMFGVSFAFLKTLTKKIDVDHELALALWDSGNFDARNLAVKIVDPARMTPSELDRWAREVSAGRMCGSYVGMVAGEGPHAEKKVAEWLASKDEVVRCAGWSLLAHLAHRDEKASDAFFEKRLAEIEKKIHNAPNLERDRMNQCVIAIGGRSRGLRKAGLAAAKRIGKVEIDYGDTACKTADATEYIEKMWDYATAKDFDSPAAQERARETPRRRC